MDEKTLRSIIEEVMKEFGAGSGGGTATAVMTAPSVSSASAKPGGSAISIMPWAFSLISTGRPSSSAR